MSKRQSTGQTNTLFNYFQSPKGKPYEKQVLNTSNNDLDVSNNGQIKTENGKCIICLYNLQSVLLLLYIPI